MEFELLSYRELAARKGWKPDSARRAVLRNGWDKTVAPNGGLVLIKVPTDFLKTESDAVLKEASADELDGLQTTLESERRRAASAEADRDAWRSQAITNGAIISKLLERL